MCNLKIVKSICVNNVSDSPILRYYYLVFQVIIISSIFVLHFPEVLK